MINNNIVISPNSTLYCKFNFVTARFTPTTKQEPTFIQDHLSIQLILPKEFMYSNKGKTAYETLLTVKVIMQCTECASLRNKHGYNTHKSKSVIILDSESHEFKI